MNLEEKIKYYEDKYGKNGLPIEIGTLEFFDDEFLNYLLSIHTYNRIEINATDFNILLNNASSFNKAIQLLLSSRLTNIKCDEFYILLKNNDKLFNYIANLIVSKNILLMPFSMLLKDRRILELLKPLSKTNPDLFIKLFRLMRIDDQKEMVLDPIWKNIYYQTDLDYFFTNIDRIGVDNIGINIINSKIESLNYEEVIKLLTKYYNSETNEPEYMRNIYIKYENEIRKYKIVDLLERLVKNSSEETITKAKELLNTNVGMEVFLSSFKIDEFEKISKILGFNPEINNMRRNRFLEILNNYEMYSLDTIKNIFSLYYFEKTSWALTIDIGVILKYADTSNEAKKILGSLKESLEKAYNYLNGNQSVNPLEVIKGFSANSNIINEIMTKMYNLFNQDVNKSINSEVVLKNATTEEKNGVLIYHLDNKNEGMFLVHSIADSDENCYKKYCEKAENHGKICMSILDANHTKPFVNGMIFGYLNIENQLYSALVCDAATNQISVEERLWNSDLYPINQFMNYTNSWNELTYLTNNKIVMPSYILCIDREPNDSEIKVAKDFGIPIYVYPKRKEIVELLSEKIEHKSYYDKSSSILIIPKELSKDIIVTPDETSITFNENNTHRL